MNRFFNTVIFGLSKMFKPFRNLREGINPAAKIARLFSLVVFLLLISQGVNAQTGTVSTRGVTVNGTFRWYLFYEPAAYTGQEAWPLVINYHGHQSNATNQMNIHSKMNAIADTAHFLVAYPQGLNVLIPGDVSAPGWNLPGLIATQDDILFTDMLLQHIQTYENVDPARIYATGWSNGSMFAFWLAFKRPDVLASVAGVSGPFTFAMLDSFTAVRPFSSLYMHGTADPVVDYYNGLPNLTGPAPDTPAFWVNQNNCNHDSIVTELPNIFPADGSTVTRIQYTGCDNNTEVLFYRVNNGGHGWPGGTPSQPFLGNTNFDINANSDIWNFFKRNPHPNPPVGIEDDISDVQPEVFALYDNYPNPFNPSTLIRYALPKASQVELKIFNVLGQSVRTLVSENMPSGEHAAVWDGRNDSGVALSSGTYFYRIKAGNFTDVKKMLFLR